MQHARELIRRWSILVFMATIIAAAATTYFLARPDQAGQAQADETPTPNSSVFVILIPYSALNTPVSPPIPAATIGQAMRTLTVLANGQRCLTTDTWSARA